ncbi:MAG: hypothetical protein QOF98_2320 [Streptomyces sp.]|nr:hypothetical protein [Streptomyces sp.]
MSRTRVWLFGLTLVVYVAIVVGVVTTSKLVTLDWQVMLWRPYKQWPQIHAFLDYFVVLGQRGPTAVVVLAWLGWRSWRHRTLHPLLVLGTSLLLLNVTVGAVKYGLGRLGPHYATTVGSSEMFAGGDIFPSGHTANAVVTWGVLAYLATTQRARRLGSVISALLSLGVGATTVYLGTHWVSDVLLGWAAGLLILLALPWFEPAMATAEDRIMTVYRRLRDRSRRAATAPVRGSATTPVAGPALVGPRATEEEGEPSRETIGAGSTVSAQAGGSVSAQPGGTATAQAAGSHPLARPPAGRGEHTPLSSPLGNRRPPAERPGRPTPTPPLVHRQARGRGAVG